MLQQYLTNTCDVITLVSSLREVGSLREQIKAHAKLAEAQSGREKNLFRVFVSGSEIIKLLHS